MAPSAIVINLDRSPDRLAHISGEFGRAGMTFERFAAVDGVAIPDSVKPYFCDDAGKIVSPLRPGEIGCYASHLAVWQQIAAGKHGGTVLVCEDDMALPAGFRDLLAAIAGLAPSGWDLINLSGKTKRAVVPVCRVSHDRHLVRFSRDPGSLAGYLISQAGARKLLAPGIRRRGADQDTRRPWAFGLRTLGLYPPLPEASIGTTNDYPRGTKVARSAPADMLRRPIYGISTLGLRMWAQCAAWNAVGRKLVAG